MTLPPPSGEGRPTRAVRWFAGGVTDAWCSLTGLSNYTLARGLWLVSVPPYIVANLPFSPADYFWVGLWMLVVAVIMFASYRRQANDESAMKRGFRPRLWAGPVETVFLLVPLIWLTQTDTLVALMSRLGSHAFFFGFFVWDHHNAGGKSVLARARDSVKAMLSKVSLPVLRPALQPSVVRS